VRPVFRILILVFGALAALGIIWKTALLERISTDVTDLITQTEGDRDLQILAKLRKEQSNYLFARLDGAGTIRWKAAELFRSELSSMEGIRASGSGTSPSDPEAILQVLLQERFPLLFPSRLTNLHDGKSSTSYDVQKLARKAVADLDEFLSKPGTYQAEEILPADPLLLVIRSLDQVEGSRGSGDTDLVWAEFSQSIFDHDFRESTIKQLEDPANRVRTEFPEIELQMAGSIFFSEANVADSRAEVLRINLISLLGIVFLVWLCFPKPSAVLHLLVLIVFAFLGGTAAVAIFFGQPHILAFLLGSVLSGICVDYGLHILIHRSKSGDNGYEKTLRTIKKPLLGSGLSTIAGFLLVCFSDVALLQETGLFVAAGLATALVVCWVYFPLFHPNSKGRAGGAMLMERIRPRVGNRAFRKRVGLAFSIILVLVGMAGFKNLSWEDNIRQLNVPHPALQEELENVLQPFGLGEDQHTFLSYGKSLSEAVSEQGDFLRLLSEKGYPSSPDWSSVFPSPEALSQSQIFATQDADLFLTSFQRALNESGFEAEVFSPFFKGFRSQVNSDTFTEESVDRAAIALGQAIDGPASFAFHSEPGLSWLITRVEGYVPPLAGTPALVMDRDESINRILTRYRDAFLDLSLPALGLVTLILVVTFRRDGIIAALISSISVFTGLGLVLLAFGSLNLFALAGAFVGFCLALDYTLFARLTPEKEALVPASVMISAATSGVSFCILATSKIEAVQCLGVGVLGSIACSVLLLVAFGPTISRADTEVICNPQKETD